MRAPLVLVMMLVPLPALADMPRLPLHFIRNVGQADAMVLWHVKGAGPDLYFARDEVVLVEPPGGCGDGAVLRMRFVDASPDVVVEPLEGLPGVANFYHGNRPEYWRELVPMHAGLTYRGAWDGIDAVYRGTHGRLKAEFEVAPFADHRRIRLEIAGAKALRIRDDGALVIATESGELVEEAPVAWEETPAGRRPVSARFVLLSSRLVSFEVGSRDPRARLVIDPVLDYSSHLGGGEGDSVTNLAASGVPGSTPRLLVGGMTRSLDFPSALSPLPHPGSWDVFNCEMDPASGTIGWVTLLGGSADEQGSARGGTTYSDDLPVTPDAPQLVRMGDGDGFIAVLDDSGRMRACTYAGGSQLERAESAYWNYCLLGQTFSSDFPGHRGPFGGWPPTFDRTLDGPSDGFFSCLVWAGPGWALRTAFVGGSGHDSVDGWGAGRFGAEILLAGWTESDDFPVGTTPSPLGTSRAGGRDAFVALVTDDLDELVTSVVLGGAGDDEARATCCSPARQMGPAVAGVTSSLDFPLLRPVQPAALGGSEGWVAVITLAFDTIAFSSYLGGSADDELVGIACRPDMHLAVAGTTRSDDLALVQPLQDRLLGPSDAMIARINPFSAPPRIEWSTYLGGLGSDTVAMASLMEDECIVLGGMTDGAFPTRRAAQALPGGGEDGFVARVCDTDLLRRQDSSQMLVEVLERLERIEERLVGLDLGPIEDSLGRLEACCDLTQRKLDDLGDFADDATDRLARIEDLLGRLLAADGEELLRDVETSLFRRECVPWLWLPDPSGRLQLAREHVLRRLEQSLASGSDGVNEHVARARLADVDEDIAQGHWQDACKRLSDALHALTTP